MNKVKKLVIPAAGYGTRFLPFAKSVPKEMIPIVDTPVIQKIVEEAVASGISEIIIVTGSNKRAVEDFFDYNFELEKQLEKAGKLKELEKIKQVADQAKFIYVRQKEQLGNGHAVLQAKEIVGNEPFAITWGDEFFVAKPPRLRQLIDAYIHFAAPIIQFFQASNPEDGNKYGFPEIEKITDPDYKNRCFKIKKIVEKPGWNNRPSNLASCGGYVFGPEIMDALTKTNAGKGGEIWLTDAIAYLLSKGQPIYSYVVPNGQYYDCGNKLSYLKTLTHFGAKDPDVGKAFIQFLKDDII